MSVSVTGFLSGSWRAAGTAVPFPAFLAFGEVGEASSILLVSLSSPSPWSSVPREPSVRESSSRSRASGPPSSSPSSSTRRRWPIIFLRRGAAMANRGGRRTGHVGDGGVQRSFVQGPCGGGSGDGSIARD